MHANTPHAGKPDGTPAKANAGEAPRSFWEHVKHFTPREFTCPCDGLCDHPVAISEDVVIALDMIRDELGVPLTIVSGTRCERYNRKIGGAPGSAHIPKNGISYAVDIRCVDARLRYRLLTAAMAVFPRIGIGKEFVHLDADPDLEQHLIWLYEPAIGRVHQP